MKYDFEDPDVYAMVKRNHLPTEWIIKTAAGKIIHHEVKCENCNIEWPCQSIKELRAWKPQIMETLEAFFPFMKYYEREE